MMSPIYKYILICVPAGFLLGFVTVYSFLDHTYKSSQEVAKLQLEFAKKDTLVQIYQVGFEKLGKDLINAQTERDFYKGKTDTLLKYSIELANPKITKKDKTDMILWIQEQNSSLE